MGASKRPSDRHAVIHGQGAHDTGTRSGGASRSASTGGSVVSFRLWVDELEEIDQAASRRQQSRSAFMREVLLRIARGLNAKQPDDKLDDVRGIRDA